MSNPKIINLNGIDININKKDNIGGNLISNGNISTSGNITATTNNSGTITGNNIISTNNIFSSGYITAKYDNDTTSTHNQIRLNPENNTIQLSTNNGTNWSDFTGGGVGETYPNSINGEIFNDYTNNVASGNYSHAENNNTTASGIYSHAEGYKTIASGISSHVEGNNITSWGLNLQIEASGNYGTHAEGCGTHAEGNYGSHSEGLATVASGECSHAEGEYTKAAGEASHAEGKGTNISGTLTYNLASGHYSHVEGKDNIASGNASHAEGYRTTAYGEASHCEGKGKDIIQIKKHSTTSSNYDIKYNNTEYSNISILNYSGNLIDLSNLTTTYTSFSLSNQSYGISSHVEGQSDFIYDSGTQTGLIGINVAYGNNSHSEGYITNAINDNSHSEGNMTITYGLNSHAEGCYTTAGKKNINSSTITYTGDNSHAEGNLTTASGENSHSEGYGNTASGENSHSEGYGNTASGANSHAECYGTKATNENSHAEGKLTTASGANSHAEGNGTTASGAISHAEGNGTTASGANSHAEGNGTNATEENSHAEGYGTTASGKNSHAEGYGTIASYNYSHASGYYTKTSMNCQTVIGMYNNDNNTAFFIVGNGKSTSNRKNAFIVDSSGNISASGNITGNSLILNPFTSDPYHPDTNHTNPQIFFNIGGGTSGQRNMIFRFNPINSGPQVGIENGVYIWKNSTDTTWQQINVSNGNDPTKKPPSLTINHLSIIDNNTNLNSYNIGQPIFLSNKYYNYNIDDNNYHFKYMKILDNKININNNTCNETFFNITNINNNNFVGICTIISKPVIIYQYYNDLLRKYFFDELTQEEIIEKNIDINNLPENYIVLYKINSDMSLEINQEKTYYYDKPVISFATHGDYMFYVNDTEALIDTNLNTQKYYEVGDELTYDGKILILPEFNPNSNLTETQQLQELIDYNKKLSNYNKLKKNSIGKITHIFTSEECDDYKHYIAVFKTD